MASNDFGIKSRERSRHRYRALAVRKLPAWAPLAIIKRMGENFSNATALRRNKRIYRDEESSHVDCTNPYCPHCNPTDFATQEAKNTHSLLIRLCTYPDMRNAWRTITTKTINGQLSKKHWTSHVDGDVICELLLIEIERQLRGNFSHIPKQSLSQTKKSAAKISTLARKLTNAIKEHEGGELLSRDFLATHFSMRNLIFRTQDDNLNFSHLANLPPYTWPSLTYEPDARESTREYFDDDSTEGLEWSDLPAVERFDWLCHEVRSTSLGDLLISLADTMDRQTIASRQIVRPGSGDPRVRILTKALSDWTQAWYGNPLDDVVACFVSAILDLDEPLARDDVRSRRKRAAGT